MPAEISRTNGRGCGQNDAGFRVLDSKVQGRATPPAKLRSQRKTQTNALASQQERGRLRRCRLQCPATPVELGRPALRSGRREMQVAIMTERRTP